MTITTTARTFATAAAAIGCVAAVGVTPAHANTEHLTVAAVGAPVWMAGHSLAIHVTVTNPDAQLMCDTTSVRLRWTSPNGKRHGLSMAGRPTAGAWAGTMRIPARGVRPGMMRYSVTASETCGVILTTTTYAGSSPTSATRVTK